MTTLPADLAEIVGSDHVLVDDDVRSGYEHDWTGRYGGRCAAVVRPATVDEVARVVEICARRRASIIPQGGNTGLVGGGVPRPDRSDQVVLSTRRFQEVDEVDPDAMQVTAGAGVTLATWRDRARAAGLDTPIDFAARDSATVGGAIATDAGGSRVVRFGTMRRQVVGVEAVLADGSVVGSLRGLPKETAGLHWPSLFCGGEGTFGIVTRARLRVVPWYRRTSTAMVSVESTAAAIALLASLRRHLDSLDAVELIRPGALDLVSDHLARSVPVSVRPEGSVLIVDCSAHDDPTDDLHGVLTGADGLDDSAVASEPGPRAALIAFRDRITESIAAASTEIGVPAFKLDVAVPLTSLHDLLTVAERAARRDGCRLVAFGHLAEGNVHLNHLGASDPDAIAEEVLVAVADMGGTISAEHGIGVAKSGWLRLIRRDTDLAAQRAITEALDPDRVFNPGVLGR